MSGRFNTGGTELPRGIPGRRARLSAAWKINFLHHDAEIITFFTFKGEKGMLEQGQEEKYNLSHRHSNRSVAAAAQDALPHRRRPTPRVARDDRARAVPVSPAHQ
jgi:hypothetical protein